MKRLLHVIALFAFVANVGIDPAQAQGPVRKLLRGPAVSTATVTAAVAPQPTPAAQVTPSFTATPDPLEGHYALIKLAVAKELVKQGTPRLAALKKAFAFTNEEIAALVPSAEKMASQETGQQVKLGKIGDGSIIKAIEAFFASPQGQALMAALIKLLLGLIGAKADPVQFWHSALQCWNA